MGLIKMESFLLGSAEQPLSHGVLVGVLWQLEIVDAGIDRWVCMVVSVHLTDDGETRVKVSQTTGR